MKVCDNADAENSAVTRMGLPLPGNHMASVLRHNHF
jgi:hypothetical protein